MMPRIKQCILTNLSNLDLELICNFLISKKNNSAKFFDDDFQKI